MITMGVFERLIEISASVVRINALINVATAMSNFCRGKNPYPDFNIVSNAIPQFSNMLSFPNDNIVREAAWALSFLSDDTGDANFPENHRNAH